MSATSTRTSGVATTAGALLAISVLVNLTLFGIGSLLGAAFTVDNAGTMMSAGVLEVTAASIIPLSVAIVTYVLLAARVEFVRRAWTPVIAIFTLASLGGLLGASDLTTGIVLGMMHLVVGGLAAFGIPARMGR